MINRDFIYCNRYTWPEKLEFAKNSLYICSAGVDERTSLCASLAIEQGIQCVCISEVSADYFISDASKEKILLREESSMNMFIESYKCSNIYIDVTGIDNRVTAPLLKCSLRLGLDVHVIYVEPMDYNIDSYRSAGFMHDLADRIEGVSPLPMFTALHKHDNSQYVFMLGFEGGRFQYMWYQLEPEEDNVIPVFGVPGYKLEYPFVAIRSNAYTLQETHSMGNIRYADASSIVDACFLLKHLRKNNPYMCLVPIGTRPHVVASILFAIKYPNDVEIYYDNPTSILVKTIGVRHVIECNVTRLIEDL